VSVNDPQEVGLKEAAGASQGRMESISHSLR
jgi:hypothetical protein